MAADVVVVFVIVVVLLLTRAAPRERLIEFAGRPLAGPLGAIAHLALVQRRQASHLLGLGEVDAGRGAPAPVPAASATDHFRRPTLAHSAPST